MAKLINIKKVTNADEAAEYNIEEQKEIPKFEFMEVNVERNDLISRSELINRLRDAENNTFNGVYRGIVKAHKIVANMPSAQRTGKWIDHDDEGYVECPFCGSCTNSDGNIKELHYCFNCGARMVNHDTAD